MAASATAGPGELVGALADGPRPELGVEERDSRFGDVVGGGAQHPGEGQDRVLPHQRRPLLEDRHEGREVGRDLCLAPSRDPRSQQGAQDTGGGKAGTLGDVNHRHHFVAGLGHEVRCHSGQPPRPVCLDHLRNGRAASGQVFEHRQALGRTGLERVVETGVAPGILGIHPVIQPTTTWPTAAPTPSP